MTSDSLPVVDDTDIFLIVADWGRRAETAEAIAARLIAVIERLQAVDPVFTGWSHWDDEHGRMPFDPRLDVQVARVIDGIERGSTGRLFPELGSRLHETTEYYPRSRNFTFWMFAGNDNDCHDNNVRLGTDVRAVPDPDVITYRVFRGALLALAESFEVTMATAFPADLVNFRSKDPAVRHQLEIGWISYVAPRFAPLVTPPPGVIVEYRPNGGLLMAATDETFVTGNPTHLAAARAIEAAVAPFNAVPWTPDVGR